MVSIYPGAREYIRATITGAPETGDIEITTDWQTWHPVTRDGNEITFLAQGPDAPDLPDTDVLKLPVGRTILHARLIHSPEIIIRHAGHIDIHNPH